MLCTADDPFTPLLVVATEVFLPGLASVFLALGVIVFWKKLSPGWRLIFILLLVIFAGASFFLAILLAGGPCPEPDLPVGFMPSSEG